MGCNHSSMSNFSISLLVCDLNRTPIVMAKRGHGGSCVHFSGISTCGRTSPETVSHPQRQPLQTPYKISLPVCVVVTNKRLQPLTKTLYNSLVLFFSLFKFKYFIASYTWQGVHWGLYNNASLTYENFTKHNIKRSYANINGTKHIDDSVQLTHLVPGRF